MHPYRAKQSAAVSTAAGQKALSFSIVGTASSTAPKVLILSDYDGPSTTALTNAIANAGYQVTLRPAPEYTWDGTNPSLEGFSTVVHLNGATFFEALPEAAQVALNGFVQGGGGFIGAQWNAYERASGMQNHMSDLVLQEYGGDPTENCAYCAMTFNVAGGQEAHPIVDGLPSNFTFRADAHDAGAQIPFSSSPSKVLMRVPSGAPAVLARELGKGKVVNFSFGPNYENFDMETGALLDRATLMEPNIQRLYVNAVRWTAGGGNVRQSQTITFGSLGNKTFGDPPFTVSATASSNLPVSFTSMGGCSVTGSTVTLNLVGTCTIIAHQAGNESFDAAQDVAQSFTVNPATPVIHWDAPAPISAGTPLGAAQLNATATGVGGVTLSGTFVYLPAAGSVLAAGVHSLSVEFIPTHVNYRRAIKTVSISVTENTRLEFTGFYRPVRNLPARNRVKAGRAVVLRFSVGGNLGMGILATGSPSSRSVSCGSSSSSESSLEGLSSVRKSGLHYDRRSRRYHYIWKTDPSWAGTCRMFVLTLVDGSTHEALFYFPKKQRERDDDRRGRDDDRRGNDRDDRRGDDD